MTTANRGGGEGSAYNPSMLDRAADRTSGVTIQGTLFTVSVVECMMSGRGAGHGIGEGGREGAREVGHAVCPSKKGEDIVSWAVASRVDGGGEMCVV